jgi:arylsulfatase A-like enzyme
MVHTSRANHRSCVWAVFVCLALIFLVAITSCSSRQGQDEFPNIIVIVTDTVRSDHLGCYGYPRPTSPNIDAFARSATHYLRSVSSSCWSIPSHASLFTGKDAFQHGAHRVKDENNAVVNNALPPHNLTLAEMLYLIGYQTGAVVANDVFLGPDFKLNRGFQTYDAGLAYGDSINLRVFDWLDRHKHAPFMLFINYMDAHKPYNPNPQEDFPIRPDNTDPELPIKAMEMVQQRLLLPVNIVQNLKDQYDLGIRNLDSHVGELLNHLKKKKLYDNSIIVLTSDHGESFGEHRFVLHGNDVYEEEVRVPLILKAPHQREGETVEQFASGSDVPRLVMQHLPAEIVAEYETEFPNTIGNHPVISENYFSHKQLVVGGNWPYDRVRTAVYEWPYKYIHSSRRASELYNLSADPGETRNLINEQPEVARRLLDRLDAYRAERGTAEEVADTPALSNEQLEKLKSLGYIGN